MTKQMYKEGVYRVVHSVEEETKAAASGWSEDKVADREYIPITAVGVTPKGAGKHEPVLEHELPLVKRPYPVIDPRSTSAPEPKHETVVSDKSKK